MTTRFDYRNVAGKKLFKLSKTEKHWTIGELDQLTGAAKRSYLGYTTLYDQLSPRLDSLHPSAV